MATQPKHVLADVTVLDFTRNLAGPSCTRMLAEMGANVIKIELAPRGDRTRGRGKTALFVQQNRGKRSVCVNFRERSGVELVHRLIAKADVVVESFRPGVFAQMGFAYETLQAIKPDIITCSVSAMGQSGPLATRPGYDYIAQAFAGVTAMIGDPENAPYIPAVGMGDVSTGVHAALGIVAALRHRDNTGEGQEIDVALLDTYYHYHEVNVNLLSPGSDSPEPTRNGRHMTYLCPAGVFRVADGALVIMAHGQHFKDLCRAMDRTDLLEDRRYRHDPARLEIQDEVVELIETWLTRFPTRDAALAHLEQFDVPVGPVLSVAETVTHPHLVERGTVRTIHDPDLGEMLVPGMPVRFSGFPDPLPLEAAHLGAHNQEVLGEMLDLSETDLEAMKNAGILVD